MISLFPILADVAAAPPEDSGLLSGWNIVWVIVGALFVYLLLRYRVNVVKFIGEVRVELDKCSWPWDPNLTGFKKFRELRDSTVVVILSVILLAGFVTTCDFILTHLVGFLTGTAIARVK